MSDIKSWSSTASNNNSSPPNGWPEGMARDMVNNTARENMRAVRKWYLDAEWVNPGGSPTYVSLTQFTIADDSEITDYSQYFKVGRLIKLEGSGMTTEFATITNVSYGAPTTTVDFTGYSGGPVTSNLTDVSWWIGSETNITQLITNTAGAPENYVAGLVPSQDAGDTNHDVNVTAGLAQSADNTLSITKSTESTKQTDAVWAAGDDAGGMPTTTTETGQFTTDGAGNVTGIASAFTTDFVVGDVLYSSSNSEARRITNIGGPTTMTLESDFSIAVGVAENVQKSGLAPNCTYHVHLIAKADGSNDLGFDTRIDASNLLADATVSAAGFVKYVRVGSIITDGSENIESFTAIECAGGSLLVSWAAVAMDLNGANTGNLTISVPLGVQFLARVHAKMNSSDTGASTILDYGQTSSYTNIQRQSIGTEDAYSWGGGYLLTSASAQIVVNTGGGGVSTVAVTTYGYLDPRR